MTDMQPQPGGYPALPPENAPARREYDTIEKRYQTLWPGMVTVLWWRWTDDLFSSLYRSMPGPAWLKGTLAALVGLVPAAGLLAGYLVCVALMPLWPSGLLWMLPVRIAVSRRSGQYGMIYACCLLAVVTSGITWIVAMITAMRDRPQPQYPTYPPPAGPGYGYGPPAPMQPGAPPSQIQGQQWQSQGHGPG